MVGLIDGVPAALLLSLAFATGAAAQKVLAAYVDRLERNALGDMPEAWLDFIVTPRSPLAVFGGGNG